MADETHQAVETTGQAQDRAAKVLTKLISQASANRVYSEPVVAGDKTVITAAEIRTGLGFGYGLASRGAVQAGHLPFSSARRHANDGAGPRGGGGGGGQAVGRPVAVVTIDPEGVAIQPVLDRTRIVVTALTALGAIGLTLIKGRRAGRR